ncbi:MAG: hypothetical protein GY953_00455, partial [bacterium]|nr:hypothetical protein [bacterium]
LGFAAATAGAFLSKGLIGVAFPVGIALVYMAATRELPPVRPRWLLWGGLLFAALAAPWHIAMEIRNPGFLEIHFFEEQILRFFSQREPMDIQSVPLLLFWLLIPLWFLPWTCFLPAALRLRRSRTLLLAACWFALVVLFFSISSRLEHYAFPLLPPLAVIVGVTLVSARSLIWSFRFLAVLGGTLLAASAGLGWFRIRELALGDTGTRLQGRNQDNDFTLMFDLPPQVLHDLLIPAIAVTLCLGAGFLAAHFFAKRNRLQPAVASILAGMVVFQLSAVHSLRICEDLVSSKSFGVALAQIAEPGDKVVVVGDYETANSINFYAPVQLLVCEGGAASLGPGLGYPDAPRLVVTIEEVRTLWRSGERAYV